MARPTLTVWTFQDADGRHHPAVPVASVELGGRRYALAVSDRPGMLVLEEKDGSAQVVLDRAVVEQVGEALRASAEGSGDPVLVFTAPGPSRKPTSWTARRAVAHDGQAYLVAQDATGDTQVFRAPTAEQAEPQRVRDAALRQAVLSLAGPEAPERVVLRLPGGQEKELEVLQQVRALDRSYTLGADPADVNQVYVLRLEGRGVLVPVSDERELAAVRRALQAGGRKP